MPLTNDTSSMRGYHDSVPRRIRPKKTSKPPEISHDIKILKPLVLYLNLLERAGKSKKLSLELHSRVQNLVKPITQATQNGLKLLATELNTTTDKHLKNDIKKLSSSVNKSKTRIASLIKVQMSFQRG
ncbi:MAG: hypothetical protein M2R45_03156 [Verrucomicrobia subdivision 3 bacterium]|nr:hypothetical protein [Limisphaerales bacterium]MCS1413223.1 hypothetical protein [Limisphaerales bacterium]